MPTSAGPNTVGESNLIFAYDTGDTKNSYTGRPTVNSIAGSGMGNYNNVGGNVTTSLTSTSEKYRGATVYKQTLTPLDSSGVSYLSNGSNPGLGVVIGGAGGGIGGRYTGHSIFFKPTGPMHSTPIFTNYSNIGGWQSSTDYEDMGDGWFRAKVIWYGGSTASDGKYWAINPAGATVGVPITIYWAGPFKEDLNSTTISQFIDGTRSATQGLLPLAGASSLDLSNMSFDSSAKLVFDGTNDVLDVTSNLGVLSAYTFEYVSYSNSAGNMAFSARTSTNFYKYGAYSWYYTHGGVGGEFYHTYGSDTGWAHWVVTYDGNIITVYENNVSKGSVSSSGVADFTGGIRIGSWTSSAAYTWDGSIPVFKMYNRALTSQEVRQNYQQYKTRFNLS